jgi:hypothetical protein
MHESLKDEVCGVDGTVWERRGAVRVVDCRKGV